MRRLTASDFVDYFVTVHDVEPYPWQRRLTSQVLDNGRWPDVIDLPTGTGKTAVLDTALFTLAARPDVFPRRIVFVIDRRIVVDQVYERAAKIAESVGAAISGILADIKSQLNIRSRRGGPDAWPLGVAALKGGIPIDSEWARRPDQPWVMVSTVDQFGSRLLFRGYGVSPRMRPVHAGLAGNDCLVILDEVHLSRPFAQTLRDVLSDGTIPMMRSVNGDRLPRRQQVIEMSATPNSTGVSGRKIFSLEKSDLEESALLRRIVKASKSAELVKIKGQHDKKIKGQHDKYECDAHETVPKQVLNLIEKDIDQGDRSIGVIVNRVRTARETHRLLRDKGFDSYLVTGRMRPIDRESVLDAIKCSVNPKRQSPTDERSGAASAADAGVNPKKQSPTDERTVVVATQAIEVGADFSFDALITEVSPLDSLRQRLGRLDRRGTLAEARGRPARCWILGVASALKPKHPDPVYGDTARVTWEWLKESEALGDLDVSPTSTLFDTAPVEAQAEQAEAPLLLPSHVDAWVQTNPEPVVQPSVDAFLHGKRQSHEPDVSLVWRWDRFDEALRLVRPRPAEFMSVPISAVKRWLTADEEVPVADIDSAPLSVDRKQHQPGDPSRINRVVRWTGRAAGCKETLKSIDEIKPGDVLIADPSLGGISDGNWDPTVQASAPTGPRGEGALAYADEPRVKTVYDLGDAAQWAYHTRLTMRLDQRLFEHLPQVPSPPQPSQEEDSHVRREKRVREWLDNVNSFFSNGTHIEQWMKNVLDYFRTSRNFDIHLPEPERNDKYPERNDKYYVLIQRSLDPSVFDGSDDMSVTGTAVKLKDHLTEVGSKAADYACRLGLTESLVDDLRLAGELHDLGKVDSRFQDQMIGHDPVRQAMVDGPLAKSLPGARTCKDKWPPLRHEFASAALISASPDVLQSAHDSDLVLHLVSTHHGFARPIPAVKKDDAAQMLQTDHHGKHMQACSDQSETGLALEMADRFWRLKERYGHHGLAWLEAILRLADHQQSADEKSRKKKQPSKIQY